MLQRAERLPTRVLVRIRCASGFFDATIGDISTGGARLLGVPERKLAMGDRIEILCLGRIYPADVRWVIDDTCGLMFVNPLNDMQIQAVLSSRLPH